MEKSKIIHTHCFNVAEKCPQWQHHNFYVLDDDWMRRHKIGYCLDATLEYWSTQSVLWHKGYHEYLSVSVKNEFSKYVAKRGYLILFNSFH